MSFIHFANRYMALLIIGLTACLTLLGAVQGAPPAQERTALAMHGTPALPESFTHFPYANPEAPKGGRLIIALQGTYNGLNPYIVLGTAPDIAPKYVLQSLMTRSMDEPFTLYALLAKSYEMPDDRSRIAFNLNEKARFSDGFPVTAEDVAFSFEMLKENGKPYHRSSFGSVKKVTVVAPGRIEFDLSGSADRELPLIIATMPIFAKHATDAAHFAETTLQPLIGSGPYAFSEIKPGESVSVKRRSDYWGENLSVSRGLYNFDEIRYDFYRDSSILFESFKAGLYDFRLESDAARWVEGYDFPAVKNGTIVKENLPIQTPKGMRGFVFNTRKPVFTDPKVRAALASLFDFDWVNRNLYFGTLRRSNSYFNDSTLSSSGIVANAEERRLLAPYLASLSAPFLDGTWQPDTATGGRYEREAALRASKLLQEAGWVRDGHLLRNTKTKQPLEFEFMVISTEQERLAVNYAASLKRLGIICNVRRVDDAQFWSRISNFDFDMIQWNWPVSASPGSEQRGRWSSVAAARAGSLNYAGASSPAIDAMIDALLAARESKNFTDAVRALDRVLLSGFYVVPLFYMPDQWVAHSARLKHVKGTPFQGVAIESWWNE